MSHNPIVIFGGTFDPPHRAHIAMSLRAATLLNAREIIFVPAGCNPQKQDTAPLAGAHRLAMLQAALADEPRTRVSSVELDRQGPSFMIDTLETLRTQIDASIALRLLIGADQAMNFHTWHRWQDIEALAEPAVLPRAPWRIADLADALAEKNGAQWRARVLPIEPQDGASQDIRTALAQSKSDPEALEHVVNPQVAAYIRKHGLYE